MSTKKKSSTIQMNNFLNSEDMEKLKRKKAYELQVEKAQYFDELTLVVEMGASGKLPQTEFWTLYHDICDNLNRVTAS